MKYEFLNREYREVKPGLWLPFTQIENKYASIIAEKESLWGKVAARSEFRLHSIEFDQLPDSFFEVKLTPGTRVLDRARKLRYTVSETDGTNPFDAAVAEAAHARSKLRRELTKRSWSPFMLWLLYINVGVLVLIVSVYIYRRWLRQNTQRDR